MRKAGKSFAAAIALFCVLLCCGASPSAGRNLSSVEQSGELRLAICDEDFPPFAFRSDNGWTGYDIELASSLARELGVHLKILTAPDWEAVIDMVHDGRADMGMSSLSISAERTRKVAFSRPYINLHQGVLANQLALVKLPGGNPLEKLNNSEAVIAVRKGSIYRKILPEYLPLATVKEFSSWEECYFAVRTGEVTGVIGDEAQLFGWLGRNKGGTMLLAPILFEDRRDPIAIAVAQQNISLLSYVDAFLLLQDKMPSIQSLYWRYKDSQGAEGHEQSVSKIPLSEYPLLVAAFCLALLIIVYFVFVSRGGRGA